MWPQLRRTIAKGDFIVESLQYNPPARNTPIIIAILLAAIFAMGFMFAWPW
jgi:hypothetical protein